MQSVNYLTNVFGNLFGNIVQNFSSIIQSNSPLLRLMTYLANKSASARGKLWDLQPKRFLRLGMEHPVWNHRAQLPPSLASQRLNQLKLGTINMMITLNILFLKASSFESHGALMHCSSPCRSSCSETFHILLPRKSKMMTRCHRRHLHLQMQESQHPHQLSLRLLLLIPLPQLLRCEDWGVESLPSMWS